MANNLFSFIGQSSPDQTAQAGLNQYAQQGQSMIDPGKAAVAQSNPIKTAGMADFAKALMASQIQPLPAQANVPTGLGQIALGQSGPAMTTPQAMDQASFMNGGQPLNTPGPTQQALGLAQGLIQQPNAAQLNRNQQFMNGVY